jgi:hypothetical protein
MDIGVFIPSGSQFDNQIPDGQQRKGSVFWSFLQPVLDLPQEHEPWHNEGVSPNIARIRAYEARRLEANNATPPRVTLADLASEAVTHVVDAVKRTKTQLAIKWLQDVLKDGPVPQKEIESRAVKDSITAKPLKHAKAKLRVESVRKGQVWRWQLPFAGKLPPKKSTRKRSDS